MNDARDVCRPPTISYAEPEHEMHLNRERYSPYRRFRVLLIRRIRLGGGAQNIHSGA
jgi:hypothetical protein